jgi:crossover junction endonuclease MUS81
MAQIILDYREHGLIELLPTANKENLAVGDIIIRYHEYEFILERKTIADLLSSIKDGRYKEQKIRLVSYMKEKMSHRRIAYILEGDVFAESSIFYSESDKNTVLGFLVSSNMRDNIPIFHAKDRHSTKSILEKLTYRLMKDTKDFFPKAIQNGGGSASSASSEIQHPPILDEPYTATIKMKKKENLNSSSWWLLSLTQIPGVSHSMAEMIIITYPTIESLISQYQNPDIPLTNKEMLLADIRISPSDTARKLGKVVSTRIYQFIFASETSE